MGRYGKPRNRYARLHRARLYFRPPLDEAPKFWPRDANGLRWASIMSGGSGWMLVGDADVLTGREIEEARLIFGMEYEHAEFREESV